MQRSPSYEWLLDSCLQECRKSIAHLEQLAETCAPACVWLEEDLTELLALEAAAVASVRALKQTPDVPETRCDHAAEELDRLQGKLLQSFQHLALGATES